MECAVVKVSLFYDANSSVVTDSLHVKYPLLAPQSFTLRITVTSHCEEQAAAVLRPSPPIASSRSCFACKNFFDG